MKFLAKILSFITVLFGIGLFVYIVKKLNNKSDTKNDITNFDDEILTDSLDSVDSDNNVHVEEIQYNDFSLDDIMNDKSDNE